MRCATGTRSPRRCRARSLVVFVPPARVHAVKGDGVIPASRVGREDPDDAGRARIRGPQARAAQRSTSLFGELRVGQHGAGHRIHDRRLRREPRPRRARSRRAGHPARPRPGAGYGSASPPDSMRRGPPVIWAAMIRGMTATRPFGSALALGERRPRALFRETARAWTEREPRPNDERWQARGSMSTRRAVAQRGGGRLCSARTFRWSTAARAATSATSASSTRSCCTPASRAFRQGRARDRDALRARLRHRRAVSGVGAGVRARRARRRDRDDRAGAGRTRADRDLGRTRRRPLRRQRHQDVHHQRTAPASLPRRAHTSMRSAGPRGISLLMVETDGPEDFNADAKLDEGRQARRRTPASCSSRTAACLAEPASARGRASSS